MSWHGPYVVAWSPDRATHPTEGLRVLIEVMEIGGHRKLRGQSAAADAHNWSPQAKHSLAQANAGARSARQGRRLFIVTQTLQSMENIPMTMPIARSSRFPHLCLLALLLLGMPMTEQVTNAQKKGGNTQPPPEPILPAARYVLTWLDGGAGWEALFPRDINQSGDVVGPAVDLNHTGPDSAFAHSSSTGVSVNLNGLAADWWDLNAAEPTLAAGWRAINAYGINDNGLIVGSATNADPNLPARPFILVGAFGLEPYFLLLPTMGAGNEYGRRINNQGEAVGASDLGVVRYRQNLTGNWPYYEATLAIPSAIDHVMDINENGHIVARASNEGGSYRQRSTGETEFVAGHQFWAVSSGPREMISGLRDYPKRGTKNGLAGGALRMPLFGAATEALVIPDTLYARALNDEGDTVFEDSGRGFLYYDAINPSTGTLYGVNGDGILPLDKLVVNQDAAWLDGGMRVDGIRNRDATALGQMCGFFHGAYRGFLLTPFVP